MNIFKSIIFFFTVLSSCLSCQTPLPSYIPKFELSKKPVLEIKEGQDFDFGYLQVPEDRSKPNGKIIELPVYIFKSRSKNPKKDPIIYTVGGPGNSSMYSAPYMNYYKYLDDRDFILFEQRGTKFAKPHLACPEWGSAIDKTKGPTLNQKQKDSIYINAARNCRERLLKEGNNLNMYTTVNIAADIEDLRKVLHIEKYNLLTISYSTKIAQVLLRDYPDAIRSVVMDSPLPIEVNYDEESIKNLLDSYNKLFADCASEPSCNQAYPDLRNRFFDFLLEKTREPLEIQILHPQQKKEITFRLKGKYFISLFDLLSTSDIPNAPLMIDQIIRGDYSIIKKSLLSSLENNNNGSGIGMRLSVWCAEELPFAAQIIIQSESKKYPSIEGASSAVFDLQVCKTWNVDAVDELENKPVKSDIPVLLINGEYDPITPVRWSKQMASNLKNSFHFVFKGWLHSPTTNWSNPCAMNVANEFFNNPFQQPVLDCFNKIKKPKFTIRE
ncbi:alpha/beta fold hydrolase [Aquimarina celericrescens]|uniref:Alpha/beta fold hydrolase n=1 Tax=Aquimarina celericrescens TaxID=1964542 RepID=A0ABW5AUV1_9FLAO|nr:alpha/beta fold hydrolase [Aquimarina celericrescens]